MDSRNDRQVVAEIAHREARMMSAEYTHRNGESDPPTVEGRYWFRGSENDFPEDDPGNWIEGIFDVTLEKYGAQSWWQMDGEGHVLSVSDMAGKWWGPVMPPWNKNAR